MLFSPPLPLSVVVWRNLPFIFLTFGAGEGKGLESLAYTTRAAGIKHNTSYVTKL